MSVEQVERSPPAPALDADQLEHLQLLQDFAGDTAWMPRLFSAPHSLRWFIRSHRAELVVDGSLVKLRNGAWAVHRLKFPRAVSRILGVVP
jgi:hypothetical protein